MFQRCSRRNSPSRAMTSSTSFLSKYNTNSLISVPAVAVASPAVVPSTVPESMDPAHTYSRPAMT